MPLQPANQATFGGRCSQPATLRTHKDPGSTLRKNRPSDSWRCCSQPAMLRSHLDNGSTLRKNRTSDSWRCCSQPAMLRIHLDNGSVRAQESPKRFLAAAAANSQRLGLTRTLAALSWHNMSACTVSPCSGRGQRSRIRQAPSSPHRRNRSRIFQGSSRFRRFRFHAVFPL